jgi:hypothetical protein
LSRVKLRSIVVALLFASGAAAAPGQVKDKPAQDSGVVSAAERAKSAPTAPAGWNFAVSGDSRNCGDVIMPAIAESAKKNNAAFYWHLGDLRATAFIDEDYLHEPEHRQSSPDKNLYDKTEWDDFI